MQACPYVRKDVKYAETFVKVEKGILHWDLFPFSGFHRTPDKPINSPSFTVHDSKWRCCLYLGGWDEGEYQPVRLGLALKKPKKLNARGRVTVVPKAGSNLGCVDAEVSRGEFVKGFAFCCTLFDTATKLTPYLDDDTLHLICEVEVPFEEKSLFPFYQQITPAPTADVTSDLKRLLEWNPQDSFSDFTFKVDGKEFNVHRNILAARSPVFRRMFEVNMREKEEGAVKMQDITATIFSQVLHYIYTGECRLTAENTEEMLAAADRFDLEKLKLLCANFLSSKLDLDNAAGTLYLADTYHALELKKLVFCFISDHFQAVMITEGFKELCNRAPKLVAETVSMTASGHNERPRSLRSDDFGPANILGEAQRKRKRQKNDIGGN